MSNESWQGQNSGGNNLGNQWANQGGQQGWQQDGGQGSGPTQSYNTGGQQQGGQQYAGQQGQGDWQQGGQPQQQNWQQGGQQPAGDGVGAVFSDLGFTKSLTPSIAKMTFILISAAAVLWGVADILHAFLGDSTGSGNYSSSLKMNVGAAIFTMLADLAIVGAIVLGARVALEAAVKHAQRD